MTAPATPIEHHPSPPAAPRQERPKYEPLLATYVTAAGLATLALRASGRRLAVPQPQDTLLLGIATFKLSRLLTKEKVLAPFREPFVEEAEPGDGSELNSKPAPTGVRGAIGELLTCPFCLSVWIATALTVLYAIAPRAARLVASGAAAVTVADVSQYGYTGLRRATTR
ncbi:MAG: DUF1360 domain-containing protein [Acidimicrobiales bacterium]|nr:DUF1360 domain-containing protein [Acidimicrobiales bacterium]